PAAIATAICFGRLLSKRPAGLLSVGIGLCRRWVEMRAAERGEAIIRALVDVARTRSATHIARLPCCSSNASIRFRRFRRACRSLRGGRAPPAEQYDAGTAAPGA